MRTEQHGTYVASLVLCLTVVGCADRGQTSDQMQTNEAQSTIGQSTAASESRQVRVTGCFQEMKGFDNFVLSNVGDAPGVEPGVTRSYRIEQSGDLEQYVGKQVTITGRVDADEPAGGVAAGKAATEEVDFNDLPELHVDSATPVSDNCGSSK